ncbi:synaptic plasticity regulator PANTS [Discoglossus pictus]
MAVEGTWRPPRSCDDYWSEWKLCKSLRNLFHNYYTYGTAPACQQWKEDHTSCREWERSRSPQAKEALQQSENIRLNERQNNTPVWSLRKKPPPDWYLPLDTGKPRQ